MSTHEIDYRSLLADAVRKHRRQKALSQNELAEACQLTQATVSDIENGRSNPTLEVLCKLARVFEVPPFALVGADVAVRELGRAFPPGDAAFGVLIGALVGQFGTGVFSRWLVKSLLQSSDPAETLPMRSTEQ